MSMHTILRSMRVALVVSLPLLLVPTLAHASCSSTPGIRVGPSDGASTDRLGTNVAVSGSTALLGAPNRRTVTFVSTRTV